MLIVYVVLQLPLVSCIDCALGLSEMCALQIIIHGVIVCNCVLGGCLAPGGVGGGVASVKDFGEA